VHGRGPVDLLAEPAHEDVDRAVAVRLAPAPDLLEQLVPCDDAATVERERVEQLEFCGRQPRASPVDERLHLTRIDPELLDLDRIAALLLCRANAATCCRADPRDELAHRERLHEVVVGADVERVHAVVLGPAGGHDDDRRPNPFGARSLDQLPAVELRQHQVEDADIRVLEAQARQPELTAADDDRVEAGSHEMSGHAVGDHIVVLDDQDLGHVRTIDTGMGHSRFRTGDDLVKRFFRKKPNESAGEVAPVESEPPAIADHTYTRSFDELRTGFTASVSHELRTPLARILALLDLTDLADADVPGLIDQARAEVENAGALIDEILFLSELESGREIVSLGHTTALPVMEGVVEGLAGAATRAGVEMIVEGDDDVDLPLRPRMLRMVVENLAENSIRYAGHGSRFTLSIRRTGEFAVLSASDNGQGVAEENLPRLFERFYRTDSARTSRGTGLGLAIVKHVVVAAGGDVEADGGPGRGLRIRCTFPA
jgi:signal transduction histidine kinase